MPRWNNPNCGFQKGYKQSKEHTEKSRKARKGRKNSKEHTENIKQGMLKMVSRKIINGESINQFGDYKGGYQNKLHHNRQDRIKRLNAKGSHTLEEWEALKKKYNYMCLCCKRFEPEITLSEDHIIPLTLDGTDYIDNIQPLCRSCNSRKKDKIINYILPTFIKEKEYIEI